MARTGDPHSATSQFFINHADNAFLNFSSESMQGWGYAVFGRVITGFDIIDDIGHRATVSKASFTNLPDVPVIIEKMSVVGDATN